MLLLIVAKTKIICLSVIVNIEKKIFFEVMYVKYESVESIEFCLSHVLPCHNLSMRFSAFYWGKKTWLTSIHFCTKIIFCRCSVKFSTVPGQCGVL